MSVSVHQQFHGYRSGHQLLQSSVRLDAKDQDTIDHLSDMAGPLRPGERFDAYISGYPLPSQSYFALARTEQDLNAPRAGCVTTRTLLVPMAFWKHEACPAFLAELLTGQADCGPLSIPTKVQPPNLAPVSEAPLAELVEALFLEKRNAIVVFDSSNSEEIALRLLTALWPGMRRDFSICTFVLSPRTLSGKSFDLLFAPKSARTRFSDWEGRRIEASGKAVGERHRWTSHVVERIFLSPVPYLLDIDDVGSLAINTDEGNASILRLSLLWEELRRKAVKSPTAVLGLIDVANSRAALASTRHVLEPAIADAVIGASETMGIRSAWNFLTTLVVKLGDELLTDTICKAISYAGTNLTKRDWGSALNYLAREVSVKEDNTGELLHSIAASLATIDAHRLTKALVVVPPEPLIKMALLDDELLARIFSATNPATDAALIKNLTQGFQYLTPNERSQKRLRFMTHIRGDRDSILLTRIVADAQATELVEAVDLLWGARTLRTPQIGEILCHAAIANDSRLEVRTAFAHLGNDDQTNNCVERLLTADPTDMKWLLENTEMENRRTAILNSFIEKSNPDDLAQAFGTVKIATEALNLLAMDLTRFAATAARIVVLPCIAARNHVTLGLKIHRLLHGPERATVAQSVVSRALTDPDVRDGDLPERVMTTMFNDIDVPAAIAVGLGANQDGLQVSRALVAFDNVMAAAPKLIGANVQLMVQLIARRPEFDLTQNGSVAIARLIETVAQFDRPTHLKICSTILPFSVAALRKPASPIIIAAFPAIYDRLRKDSDHFRLSRFFSFDDWDRCKTARRELVRAFMASQWPPVDLAITAFRAGELKRILKRLLKEPKGASYLVKVEEGARRVKATLREPVLEAIEEVRDFG